MKKRLLGLVLMVITLVAVLTIGASAEGEITTEVALILAIASASEDDIITLDGNIALNSTLAITNTNSFTIDGGASKYGFTYAGTSAAIQIQSGADVTLSNLSITATSGIGVQMYGYTGNTAEVTIDVCTVTAEQPIYVGAFKGTPLYSYYNTVTVEDSYLKSTQSILTFQSSKAPNEGTTTFGDTVVAGTVSITGSTLNTAVSLVQFDENSTSNCSGLQDITIKDCTIIMPDDGNAISADHSSVASYGTFLAEIKMDDDTMSQIPGVAYALGAKGGLVVNIYTLDDFGYDSSNPTYARYGTTSTSGYYYSFTKTLQLVEDIELNSNIAIYFGGASNGVCADATFDLNGHTLTLEEGVVLTLRGNNAGELYTIGNL